MVSIIIPVFNGSKFIKGTIECCLAQTYKDIEIIIVNDCSVDETEEIVRLNYSHESKIEYKRHDKNKGLSASRNTGLACAKGSMVQFLDHDDLIAPDRIELLLNLIEGNNKYTGGIVSNYAEIDIKGNFHAGRIKKSYLNKLKDTILDRDVICPIHCFLFYRDAVEKVGGFSTLLRQCEDRDLIYRLSSQNHLFLYSNKILSFYRIVEKSMSKSHYDNTIQMLKLLNENKQMTLSKISNAIVPFLRQEKEKNGISGLIQGNNKIKKWFNENKFLYITTIIAFVTVVNRIRCRMNTLIGSMLLRRELKRETEAIKIYL